MLSVGHPKQLGLADNELETILENLFKNNPKLFKIALEDKKIKFINANVFNHLSNLENIDLSGNFCVDKSYASSDIRTLRQNLETECIGNPNQPRSNNIKIEYNYLKIFTFKTATKS